jgi:hypothetical protein
MTSQVSATRLLSANQLAPPEEPRKRPASQLSVGTPNHAPLLLREALTVLGHRASFRNGRLVSHARGAGVTQRSATLLLEAYWTHVIPLRVVRMQAGSVALVEALEVLGVWGTRLRVLWAPVSAGR